MLPLLEIEKINQKNVFKTQNPKSESENANEHEGFAEILNFLSLDKNSKKSEVKSKEIPVSKAQEDFKSLPKGEKSQNLLKSLDKKYNSSKNLVDSQKLELQSKSTQAKAQNATKATLNLNSAKDLLEYSKAHKQETKTLKDLGEVAESLKLNLQKISAQVGREEQSEATKKLFKQEVLPKNLKESLNTKESLAKENSKTIMQKSSKESPNILSNLLQDKELIEKADKILKANQAKTAELKEIKTTQDSNVKTQNKENVKIQSKKKEVKTAESKQDFVKTSKVASDKTIESKEIKIIQDSNVKTQNEKNVKIQSDKKEEKTSKVISDKITNLKEVKIVESQNKIQKDSNKKVQNQEGLTQQIEQKDSNQTSKVASDKTIESKEIKIIQDSNVKTQNEKNVKIQSDKKEGKTLKDSKEKQDLIKTSKVISDKITNLKEVKIAESQNKTQKDSNKKVQNQESTKKTEQKEKAEQSLKESLKVESPQSKIPQEPLKQEFVKESLKESTKEFAKKEEITQESQMFKEVSNKESQSPKIIQKVVQNSMQSPFAFKEKKEIKDSLLKEEKANNKNTRGLKDSKITSNSFLSTSLKEESIKQEMRQQELFLDDLLKTTEKPMSSKEAFKEAAQEGIKESAEKKVKVNQEIYQSSTQVQVENRLSAQNTFLHFSDRLREALQNYRPPVTKLSLELNPENLGSVELTILKRGDKLSVQISSNPNVLQLFMQNVQEFKNSLNNLGFQDVNLDFKDNAGNSLGSGDFSNSSGGEQGGFEGGNQRNPNPQERNLEQDLSENPKNTQSWNENSLHTYKEVNNPYAKVTLVEINFSYYA